MRLIHYILFTFFFIVLSFVFDYHHTTFKKPQSTHAWRQADCASFSLNYYQYNRFISHPRLHNRLEADGYMVGEFPGLYYISGQLYKIFGVHDFIPRFLNLLILFLGLLGLFKFTYEITGSMFFAYVIPLLLFSAPIVTYYGNNYLTDIPAFGFIMMGWGVFMNYYKKGKLRSLYIMGACFLIAGLLKITLLMSVVALGTMYLLEVFGWVQLKKEDTIFKHRWHMFGIFAGVVIIVAGYYLLGAYYNDIHNTAYFLSKPMAPWMLDDMGKFPYTLYRVLYFWSGYYFFTLTLYLIIFLMFFVMLGRRYPGHFLYGLTLLTFVGSFLLFQLFYYQFQDHDYYVIPGYMFVIFLLCSGVVIMKEHFSHVFNSWIFKAMVILFLGLNIYHAKSTIHDRYHGKLSFRANDALYEDQFREYLTSIGVEQNTQIISVPDLSPNTTLYLINRPGYTEWVGTSGAPMEEGHIRDFIGRGAEYLIVHDPNYLTKENISTFKEYEVGDYKGVKIFDLKPYNQ